VARFSKLNEIVPASNKLAVSILASDQAHLSALFSKPGREPVNSFTDIEVPYDLGVPGSPMIAGSAAFFDCAVAMAYESGDHSVFFADVLAVGVNESKTPLLYPPTIATAAKNCSHSRLSFRTPAATIRARHGEDHRWHHADETEPGVVEPDVDGDLGHNRRNRRHRRAQVQRHEQGPEERQGTASPQREPITTGHPPHAAGIHLCCVTETRCVPASIDLSCRSS
jgi:Flavin reductase like domain